MTVPSEPPTRAGDVAEPVLDVRNCLVREPSIRVSDPLPLRRCVHDRKDIRRVAVPMTACQTRDPVPADGERRVHPIPIGADGLDIVAFSVPPLAPLAENGEPLLEVLSGNDI